MNMKLFNELMELPLSQDLYEWKMFLEFCESYLKKHGIKNPVVVELGIWRGGQKRFWEELLGAYHIGIDAARKKSRPDIRGHTHDPQTLEALKVKLEGKSIDILFIDASHWYEHVKKDFEIYSPLCTGIVALHDINYGRHYGKRVNREVWKFWDELKANPSMKNFSFDSIEKTGTKMRTGIGIVIKK